ncbi:MAG: CdvA-like protein [Candidatus Bathyarchaeota archaeon]|nr:MAG: CdvA-like protein [Candidatus Bathyarchaeota archaeon]
MISWKFSLEKINGELELARKKRQALDKLLNEGKVSQPTYESFTSEISNAIAEIEQRQNSLIEKMKAKIDELEQQMKTMEFLLVNSEIRHVSGEIEEESYNNECKVLSLGLETTRKELTEIREAIASLTEHDVESMPPQEPQTNEGIEQTEPDAEERLEIVMDTETTTSIEVPVEESPVEETPIAGDVEQEDTGTKTEEAEEYFRREDSTSTEEENTEEAEIGEETEEAQE